MNKNKYTVEYTDIATPTRKEYEEARENNKVLIAMKDNPYMFYKVNSYSDAIQLIKQFENEDKKNSCYTPNYYYIEEKWKWIKTILLLKKRLNNITT